MATNSAWSFRRFSQWTANLMGHPMAFVLATLSCVVWAISGPVFGYSDTWQLVINTATRVLTFLAVFLIRDEARRRWAVGAAILLSLPIGTSRVLLGVHWPSDVAGGWAFGLLWVLAVVHWARPRFDTGVPSR